MDQSLPFTSIKPVRLVGASSKAPFCSIISQNKLIYASGNNIILQNTKNNEQKILYTHTIQGHIQLIVHHVTLYNEHLLAIAVRDAETLMNVIVIVSLNSAIFNLENKKETEQTFFLRHIEQYEEIKTIHFFEEGTLLGLVSSYGSISSFSLMRTSNGDVLLHQSYPHTKIFMGSASISKQGYVAVLLQQVKDGVRLCLMATDQLSRRLYYSLQLDTGLEIIECRFQCIHQDSVYLIVLVQSGDILIYKVNDFTATLAAKIAVNIKNQEGLVVERVKGMQSAGNKIVVFYENSKTISLIQYSNFNPNSNKMVVLRETLKEYRHISAVHSLRISKDTCTVAGLFTLNSKSYSAVPQHIPTSKTLNLSALERKSSLRGTQLVQNKQQQQEFIALQMDILQTLIDFNDKNCNVEETLSLFAGHAPVKKAEYCAYTNSLLLLLQNKVIKYYDLSPDFGNKGKTQYKRSKLQLWACELVQQPTTMAAHPFNFSLVLIYNDIIKFHQYNCKFLFPPHIVASIKPTNFAAFSLLGDKLILAHHSSLTIVDSYTHQILKTISLNSQPATLLASNSKQQMSKMISAIHLNSFDELMVLSGQNSLLVVSGWQKSAAFGTFEGDNQRIKQIFYDQLNKLTLVVQEEIILIFSKPSLSSTKCSLVSKLQLSASSILVKAELGALFIGADDGSLLMVKWPHYQQQDLYYLRGQNRIYLFDQPIISIHVTSNMRFLYAISQKGSFAICQLQVADGEQIIPKYKEKLLKMSDIPLKLFDCWLISRSDQERKQREIIKLRGEEVDRNGQHSQLAKQQALGCDEVIELKKKQFELKYAEQIKKYEEQLGLQQVLQSISLIKDEIKVFRRKRERDIAGMKLNTDQVLNQHFQERTKLQKEHQEAKIRAMNEKQSLKAKFKNQLTFLKEDFQAQNMIIQQKIVQTEKAQLQALNRVKIEGGSAQEDKKEQTELMRLSFQEEKQQLLEMGQTVISKNRNTNIAIHNLQNKMSEVGIEKEKIEFDMFKVELEQEQMKNTLAQLEETLQNNNIVYNRLIQKTRKLEAQLLNQRKLASKNEYCLNKLLQEMDVLEKHQQHLDGLNNSVSSEFVQVKQQQQNATRNVQNLNIQLAKLKNIKSNKNYEQGLAKTRLIQACKTLGRELELNESETIQKLKAGLQEKQEEIEQNKLGRQFQSLQAEKQKMSIDANKWKQIKDSYKAGFRRSYQKLNEENLKLTYQYNDLLKVSQEYKTYLNHLSNAISHQSKRQQLSRMPKLLVKERSKPAVSFLGGQSKVKPKNGIVKKALCISLHQQSGKFITQV